MKDVTRLLELDSQNANYYFMKGVVLEKSDKVIFYAQYDKKATRSY